MGLNVNNKKTFYLVDEYGGLMTNQHELQNPSKTNAHGDAIGHTLDAYMAYNYEPFVENVKKCFVEKTDAKGTYIQAYRSQYHIDENVNTMSRDHVLATTVLMKLANETDFLKKLSKGLRWKISDKYSFTIDSWLWLKGISGNKLYMFLFYLIDIPVTFVSILWNKIIYKLGEFGKELPQDKYVMKPESEISEKIKKYRKLVYPLYSINHKAFMMYSVPNSLGKWLMKKICLWIIDEQNFYLRVMFGDKVDEKDVYSYKSMYGGRWTTYLNDMNDRYMLEIIKTPEYITENVVDVNLLMTMYEKIGKK
jgi:hypothetical protein